MTLPEPVTPQKKDPTLWIILGIAILLVFCAGGIGLGAVIFAITQGPKLNFSLPGQASTPTPIQTRPAAPGLVPGGPLVVEAYDPSTNSYSALADLAQGYQDSNTPGTLTYSVTVPQSKPVAIFLGWCTTTSAILDENYQHLTWSLAVDDQPVDLKGLYVANNQYADRVCKTWSGLVRRWTDSQHKIVTTMTLSQKINDGWNDYPAGAYVDVFTVTVTP